MQARKYTRYPTDVPISFAINGMIGKHQHYLSDAGQGGLCLNVPGCLKLGTHLDISFHISEDHDHISGQILWCQALDNGQCLLGVSFEKQLTQSAIEKLVLVH